MDIPSLLGSGFSTQKTNGSNCFIRFETNDLETVAPSVSSSTVLVTLRVETPEMTISIMAAIKAFFRFADIFQR